MARQRGARWHPGVYRSTLEALHTIDRSLTPPAGTLFLTAQIVAWEGDELNSDDDTDNKAGEPDTERRLRVIDQDVVQIDYAAVHGKTETQIAAVLNSALDSWATSRAKTNPTLSRVFRVAADSGIRPIVAAP